MPNKSTEASALPAIAQGPTPTALDIPGLVEAIFMATRAAIRAEADSSSAKVRKYSHSRKPGFVALGRDKTIMERSHLIDPHLFGKPSQRQRFHAKPVGQVLPAKLTLADSPQAIAAVLRAMGVAVIDGRQAKVSSGAASVRLLDTQASIDATPIARPDPRREVLEKRAIEAVLRGATWLTSKEVGLKGNPEAANPHAAASRWLSQGKVFAIEHAGQTYYPSYAFDPLGQPYPAVKTIMGLLAGYSPFRLASWFESTSSQLGGARPREVLADRPEDVIAAARAHAQGPTHG